jgi:hypothetical protein
MLTLLRVNAAETRVDHELYLEVEAPTREVLHAQIDGVTKMGPGGPTVGAMTREKLDGYADKFLAKWLKQPKLIEPVSFIPAIQPKLPIGEEWMLADRLVTKVLHKVRVVAAARGQGPDVDRPKNITLLGPRCGFVVSVAEAQGQSAVKVEGFDPTTKPPRELFVFRDPESPQQQGLRPVLMVKDFADAAVFKMQSKRYPHEPGKKVKVWLAEAAIDKQLETPEVKAQMTNALREKLLQKEIRFYLFEAHDGPIKIEDAKAAEVWLILTPRYFVENNTHMAALDIWSVTQDKLVESFTDAIRQKKGS